jgi:hypothetical protein
MIYALARLNAVVGYIAYASLVAFSRLSPAAWDWYRSNAPMSHRSVLEFAAERRLANEIADRRIRMFADIATIHIRVVINISRRLARVYLVS